MRNPDDGLHERRGRGMKSMAFTLADKTVAPVARTATKVLQN
jgi:hypothetical protein